MALARKIPFGFRRGDDGELVPHEGEQEAIRDMVALRRKCLISAVRSSPKSFEGVGPAARLGGRIGSRRRIEEISEFELHETPSANGRRR